jgi:hypothetical protein
VVSLPVRNLSIVHLTSVMCNILRRWAANSRAWSLVKEMRVQEPLPPARGGRVIDEAPSPMMLAAYYGRAGIAQLLLDHGADLHDGLDEGDETPRSWWRRSMVITRSSACGTAELSSGFGAEAILVIRHIPDRGGATSLALTATPYRVAVDQDARASTPPARGPHLRTPRRTVPDRFPRLGTVAPEPAPAPC